MSDLIKALQIFFQYSNSLYPTHCEHNIMYVAIDPDRVCSEDIDRLRQLGFTADDEFKEMFSSYRYGSN